MQVIFVPKNYNVNRHYSTIHEVKYQVYLGKSRNGLMRDFRTKLKQRTKMVSRISQVQSPSLYASYAVSQELAKANKPFYDSAIVKKCTHEMEKAFSYSEIAEKIEKVPLSIQTLQ